MRAREGFFPILKMEETRAYLSDATMMKQPGSAWVDFPALQVA